MKHELKQNRLSVRLVRCDSSLAKMKKSLKRKLVPKVAAKPARGELVSSANSCGQTSQNATQPGQSKLVLRNMTVAPAKKKQRNRKIYGFPVDFERSLAEGGSVAATPAPPMPVQAAEDINFLSARNLSSSIKEAKNYNISVSNASDCMPKDDDSTGALRAKLNCVLGFIRVQNVQMKLMAEQFRSAVLQERADAEKAAATTDTLTEDPIVEDYLVIKKSRRGLLGWQYTFKTLPGPTNQQ